MANQLNTLQDAPGVIAKMAAKMFADKLQFCQAIDKADGSDYQGKHGYQAGDTIHIAKPARFIPSASADITADIQDIDEEKTPLTLDTRKVVGIELSSAEIAHDMALKSWAKRILEPAVSSLAQHVEKDFLEMAVDATANSVGMPGSTDFGTAIMLAAKQKIREYACPDEDHCYALLNPAATSAAVNARKGLFQSSDEIAKQYKAGAIGLADGFTYLTNNLLPTHVNGNEESFSVSGSINAQGAAQMTIQGLTANSGQITQGSVIMIDGVQAVHPITKEDLGYRQQFTVIEDALADGSGEAILRLSPALYDSASGGLQNVTRLPDDGDAITLLGAESGTYQQSLAFHKSAFRMVSVPLMRPEGTDMSAQETVDGMTLRVVRDYDVLSDKLIMRLDFLGGLAALRPEWACRIFS